MDGKSLDITEENLKQLQAIFPQVFTEGKIDFKRLQDLLGGDSVTAQEFYALNWAGKTESRKEIQKQTTATLIPEPERSINFDTTQNIFIEGENLEVLRTLQKSYFGKIKVIYIDPPYNTGNDSFVYPDDYSERLDEYNKRTGVTDDDGYLNKQDLWKKNTKESGQYHSAWLSMMYPRLYLARNLMTEDGVIFVSIDNNEFTNLKLLMDEIFGEENFIECISWNKRVPKNDKGVGNIHEFILIYVKNSKIGHEFLMQKNGLEEIDEVIQKLKRQQVPLNEAEKEIQKFYNKKGYDRGITLYNSLDSSYRLWGKINMSWPNANTFGPRYDILHPKTGKAVKVPDRGWRWKKETFDEAADYSNGKYQSIVELYDGSIVCGKIWFDKDENTQPSSINYLDEVDTLLLRSVLSLKSDGGIEVEKLFEGKSYFSYPKPTSLVSLLIKSVAGNEDCTVLDFFAGSGTTAHSVLELNKEDEKNRKFICIQMPEIVEEGTEAFKAGYNTVADITRARIQKVIEKFVAEANGKLALQENKPDLGFQSYRLAPSNFRKWNGNVSGDQIIEQLKLHIDSVNPAAEKEAMLRELLLKGGKPITAKAEVVTTTEGDFYHLPEFSIVVCLNGYGKDTEEKIIALAPVQIIVLDKYFERDDALSNARNTMREAGIDKFTVI